MTTDTTRKEYICPGETYSISRSVHLARLAAFYPPCRECRYRTETGQLPARTVQRLQQTERRVDRPTLFTPEGVRGIYLNELSRSKAAHITSAFAAVLLENSPLRGRSAAATAPRQQPTVIVGSDQRPHAPDIVTGVLSALRRMGCSVVDIGPTTKPCLWFSVADQQAAGGVMVTGSGCDPSWTGLDFVDAGGRPISFSADEESVGHRPSWNRLERLAAGPVARASRSAGAYRLTRGFEAYAERLGKHFHALRPLRVVVGCPARLVQRTLERVFAPLPCQLIPVRIPDRARNVNAEDDADVLRIAHVVAERNAHIGILVDDDGLRCGFVDERGRLVSPIDVVRILVRRTEATRPIVIEHEALDSLGPTAATEGRIVAADSSLGSIFDTMRRHDAEFGGGCSGRFWFCDPNPTCDAIITIANLLKALSESDAAFSRVVEQDGLRGDSRT